MHHQTLQTMITLVFSKPQCKKAEAHTCPCTHLNILRSDGQTNVQQGKMVVLGFFL